MEQAEILRIETQMGRVPLTLLPGLKLCPWCGEWHHLQLTHVDAEPDVEPASPDQHVYVECTTCMVTGPSAYCPDSNDIDRVNDARRAAVGAWNSLGAWKND